MNLGFLPGDHTIWVFSFDDVAEIDKTLSLFFSYCVDVEKSSVSDERVLCNRLTEDMVSVVAHISLGFRIIGFCLRFALFLLGTFVALVGSPTNKTAGK